MAQSNKYKRAMVVVAHADDAEFGCSGTVARWCAEGTEVVYVLCTDGSKGSSDPKMTSKRLAEIRRKEQLAAGKVLGLKDAVFLGYPDSYLQPTLDLRRDIAREIRRFKPDVLVCQYPMRNLDDGDWRIGTPDHIAAGEASLAAVFPTARDRLTFPELIKEGFEPHNVQDVLIMGHPKPDRWIDVTKYMDVAVNALMQHKSQLKSRDRNQIGQRLRDSRERAAHGHDRMTYAEAFKHFHMP